MKKISTYISCILKKNNIVFYLILLVAICSIIISFLNYNVLINYSMILKSFTGRLALSEISLLYNRIKEFGWWYTIIAPFLTTLKVFLICWILFIRIDLEKINKFTLKKSFTICLLAETILFLPFIVKFIWFSLLKIDYKMKDLQSFHPFSILSFHESETMPLFLSFPATFFSLYEFTYWLFFSFVLSVGLKISFKRSLYFILTSYVPLLLLFLAICMFFLSFLPPNFNQF